VRCLFIDLKFKYWLLDGSTFVDQAPQFSWTTQFRTGYCTVCVWTQEEVRSVIRFLWAKGTAPIEIRCEIQAVYGPNVRPCSMCENGVGNLVAVTSVTDEQRSGCPSTSADLVPAIEETVPANRQVLLKKLKEQFNL